MSIVCLTCGLPSERHTVPGSICMTLVVPVDLELPPPSRLADILIALRQRVALWLAPWLEPAA